MRIGGIVVSAALVLGGGSAAAIDIEGMTEDVSLYVEAGTLCKLRMHPRTEDVLRGLTGLDPAAAARGAARGSMLFDGMVRRLGKAEVCAAAVKARGKAEAHYDELAARLTKVGSKPAPTGSDARMRALFADYLQFKDDPRFRRHGFAQAGSWHGWPEKVQAVQADAAYRDALLARCTVVPLDLLKAAEVAMSDDESARMRTHQRWVEESFRRCFR